MRSGVREPEGRAAEAAERGKVRLTFPRSRPSLHAAGSRVCALSRARSQCGRRPVPSGLAGAGRGPRTDEGTGDGRHVLSAGQRGLVAGGWAV